jgi:hypothetical protein
MTLLEELERAFRSLAGDDLEAFLEERLAYWEARLAEHKARIAERDQDGDRRGD